MGDFTAFSEDINDGAEYLEHHGILGMKWFKKNGPPYPLGSGDHSSAEKSAAKAAGVSVGSDSGKGSIDNVKKSKPRSKSKPKVLTPEEKRQQAIDAAKSGDKKKITKNIDELTTDELRDAAERARLKDQLKREDPSDKRLSKADRDKQDAIRSGDKERIKQFADKMSVQELREAMDKVDLMTKLNYVPPEPTVMDKVRDVSQKLGNFKDAAQKGIDAYNVVAKVVNATRKDQDAKWPIIGEKPKDDKDDKKDKEKEKTKEAVKEISKQVQKSYKEIAEEKLRNDIIDYKMQKRLNEAKANIDAKEAKKEAKKSEKEAKKANNSMNVLKDWDDSDLFNSVKDVGTQEIPEETYRAELEYLNSFKKG